MTDLTRFQNPEQLSLLESSTRSKHVHLSPSITHGHVTVRSFVMNVVHQDIRLHGGEDSQFVRDCIQHHFDAIYIPRALSIYRKPFSADDKGRAEGIEWFNSTRCKHWRTTYDMHISKDNAISWGSFPPKLKQEWWNWKCDHYI